MIFVAFSRFIGEYFSHIVGGQTYITDTHKIFVGVVVVTAACGVALEVLALATRYALGFGWWWGLRLCHCR